MARNILITLLLIFSFSLSHAQTMTAEQIVQKQLETYNARDIQGFMSLFSQEVNLYRQGDPEPIATGFDQVKALYTNLFEKSPALHSTLTNRIVLGNTVIDHESITGRMGNPDELELVVIYEVKDEKIWRVTVINK